MKIGGRCDHPRAIKAGRGQGYQRPQKQLPGIGRAQQNGSVGVSVTAIIGRRIMPSTVIRTHTYDSPTRDLTITFVSGRRYVYAKVPPRVAAAFSRAPSRGAYFNHHIRDRFAVREVLPSGVDRD
jgi:hypothetical protein